MQQSNAPAMPPATSVRQPPFFLSLLPIANSRCYPRPRSRHAEVAAGARLAGGMNAVAPGASSPSVWRVVDATTTYAVPWRATPATTVLPARLPALRRVHSAQCTAGAQRRALGDAWMHGSAVRGLPASSGSIDAVQHSCLKAPQHRRRSRDGATHAMRTAARPCTSTYGRAACQPVTVSTEILSKHRCAGHWSALRPSSVNAAIHPMRRSTVLVQSSILSVIPLLCVEYYMYTVLGYTIHVVSNLHSISQCLLHHAATLQLSNARFCNEGSPGLTCFYS
jgi:hypothetical protein